MGKIWDVAVIGAGMAGLGAARLLAASGRDIILLDKGRVPGGRVCSRRQDGCIFDHGAQNVKARDTALATTAARFPAALLRPVNAPVALHSAGLILSGDEASNLEQKWAAQGGLEALARELARGLPLWTGTRVTNLTEGDENFTLYGEEMILLGQAKHVVLTAPGPQTAALLTSSQLRGQTAERVEALAAARYHRCLTVMLRYNAPLNADWYALLAEDRAHPLLWLAHENAKGYVLSSDQTALVAQLGPQISEDLYEASDDHIVGRTEGWIRETADELRALPASAWSSVKRWRYAQSQGTADWEKVNPLDSKLVVAGDALCAKSRVELAYESGLRAGRQLLAL